MAIPQSPENITPAVSQSEAAQMLDSHIVQELKNTLVEAIQMLIPDLNPTEFEIRTGRNNTIEITCNFAPKRSLSAVYQGGLITCLGVSYSFSL